MMPAVTDHYNLQRFIDAQDRVYRVALAELLAGAKQSHWMWFIFPQLSGLGQSATAKYYGIASLDEASAYLTHPTLGLRLRECARALLPWTERRTAEQILGSIDAMKLRSSMTLFDGVERKAIFGTVIDLFFSGERDERTLALLNSGA